MGLFSGGFLVDWAVRDTRIDKCGLGGAASAAGGVTHSVYIAANRALFVNVTSDCPANAPASNRMTGNMGGGHALKLRCQEVLVVGGWFHAGEASSIECPDGTATQAMFIDATVHKDATDLNTVMIGYGTESLKNGGAGMRFRGTIDAQVSSPLVIVAAGTVLDLFGSTRKGAQTLGAQGGGTTVPIT
jgi:hypothetical protein